MIPKLPSTSTIDVNEPLYALLSEVYVDPRYTCQGMEAFLHNARQAVNNDPKYDHYKPMWIDRDDVKAFLSLMLPYHNARNKFDKEYKIQYAPRREPGTNKIVQKMVKRHRKPRMKQTLPTLEIYKPNYLWCIDVLEVKFYPSVEELTEIASMYPHIDIGHEDGVKKKVGVIKYNVLTIIDAYSKFGQAYMIYDFKKPREDIDYFKTNKKISNICHILGQCFSIAKPKVIFADNAFGAKLFVKLLEEHIIRLRLSASYRPVHMIERLNKTLKAKIQYYCSILAGVSQYDLKSYLYDIVDNYNHSKHKSLNARPIDVVLLKDEDFMKQYVDKKLRGTTHAQNVLDNNLEGNEQLYRCGDIVRVYFTVNPKLSIESRKMVANFLTAAITNKDHLLQQIGIQEWEYFKVFNVDEKWFDVLTKKLVDPFRAEAITRYPVRMYKLASFVAKTIDTPPELEMDPQIEVYLTDQIYPRWYFFNELNQPVKHV